MTYSSQHRRIVESDDATKGLVQHYEREISQKVAAARNKILVPLKHDLDNVILFLDRPDPNVETAVKILKRVQNDLFSAKPKI